MVLRKTLSGAEFFSALGLARGSVVSLVGAGGKTTAMFTLAEFGKNHGLRVLVTTSTRILIPLASHFDHIDLSGEASFLVSEPGIYVAGRTCEVAGKMQGLTDSALQRICPDYDLVLIEADGSKCKPLKGWSETEPVIVKNTNHTIGLLDLSALDNRIGEPLVHRLPLFLELTGLQEGDRLSVDSVKRIVEGERGLFQYACGTKILLCNKLEDSASDSWYQRIKDVVSIRCYGASLHQGYYYD